MMVNTQTSVDTQITNNLNYIWLYVIGGLVVWSLFRKH